MEKKLQNTLVEILEYFKRGLDDVAEGSGEYQTMQNEIDYALPLVKKLTIPRVSSREKIEKLERDLEIVKRLADKRSRIMQDWIEKYDLPIAKAVLDSDS